MGRRHTTKNEPKAWQTATGDKSQSFTAIYDSLLLHPSYLSLNARQRQLYIICASQRFGKRKPSADYPDFVEFRSDDCFYLNWGAMEQYGLYGKKDNSGFYKDMQKLVDLGFIDKLASGRNKLKTIYKYSDRWHNS